MNRLNPISPTQCPLDPPPCQAVRRGTMLVEVAEAADTAGDTPTTLDEALIRMSEAEDTLRAIAAGEVDTFVVSDGLSRRVFTLTTADQTYRMFVENMRDGAATISSNGLILYANQRLAELIGRPRESIVGTHLAMFVDSAFTFEFESTPLPAGPGMTLEIDLIDAGGNIVPVLVGVAHLDVGGNALTCLTFTDLSRKNAQDHEIAQLSQAQAERMADLQNAQAALTKQATHDALTGLPNRAVLVERIEQALRDSKDSGRRTAVLFVDLDRFKHVNDTQGHAAGDTVLRRVAAQLKGLLRPMDTVARIGGDEFVVLAPDIESENHAVDLAVRLVEQLGRRPTRRDDGERVAASIGITLSVGGTGTAEILLHQADTAMYEAKARGGARAMLFDAAIDDAIHQRSLVRGIVQSALDDDRFVLHYQPIIDLRDLTLAGFEALARIREPDGTILAPSAFIDIAEESGLIVPLGAQVLDQACVAAQRWRTAPSARRALPVSVNLSARQLEPGDLPAIIDHRLSLTGLDPSFLHLELTETAIMDLHPETRQQLGAIVDLGVEIGLDDFGTGYASLTHLRRLPLTFVKIDRSFVQGIGIDESDERIVAAVVDLAANLGLRSIAEGVETIEQLDRLRELGCDQAQGYLFDQPLASADVPRAIHQATW